MPRVALITPTGGRPEAWELCQRWMGKQTFKDWDWFITDDCLPRMEMKDNLNQIIVYPDWIWKSGQNTQYNNLRLLCQRVKEENRGYEWVFVIEDDEWYREDFLEVVLGNARKDIVGEGNARYYSLKTTSCHEHRNVSHACLCRTGFKVEMIDRFLECLDEPSEKFVDLVLWRKFGAKYGNVIMNREPLSVGIKGMPGRGGIGAGHNGHPRYKRDQGLRLLKMWLGADWKYYERFL